MWALLRLPRTRRRTCSRASLFSFLRPANEALVWHFATATEKCCTCQHWGSVVPFSRNDTHKSRSAVYCRTWHAVWTTVHSMAPAQGSYRLHMAQEKGRLLHLPFAETNMATRCHQNVASTCLSHDWLLFVSCLFGTNSYQFQSFQIWFEDV